MDLFRRFTDVVPQGKLDLEDVYAYAKGNTITASDGARARLMRPLDFLVVADHAEVMGLMCGLPNNDPLAKRPAKGRRWLKKVKNLNSNYTAVEAESIAHNPNLRGGNLFKTQNRHANSFSLECAVVWQDLDFDRNEVAFITFMFLKYRPLDGLLMTLLPIILRMCQRTYLWLLRSEPIVRRSGIRLSINF